MKSLFITFEGPEGAGKTTIVHMLEKKLSQLTQNFLITREPGGIDIAEKIREIILNPNHTMMDERTEALLYAAARSQHFFEKVQPALQSGKIVLCDRFIDSSLAYQGYARGLGIDEVLKINEFAIGKRMPDLTILFDLPPEIGLARIYTHRHHEVNRLDDEHISFHIKVREGYQEIVKRYPHRIKVVDATKSIDEVFKDVWEIVEEKLM